MHPSAFPGLPKRRPRNRPSPASGTIAAAPVKFCSTHAPRAKAAAYQRSVIGGNLTLRMPRRFFRKFLPSRESIGRNRLLRLFGNTLHHPGLWHLNRRSVAGAVSVGLFAGLIPGPFQMIGAALLAVVLRVNLPL